MYDMYPEWGPTKNRTYDESGQAAVTSIGAVQVSLDLRDNGGERPDDN